MEREAKYRIWVLILACAVLLGWCQFAALARVDDIDSILFAYYGKRMTLGQRLYVDLWDNKPPGIFWVDALALGVFRGSYLGIIAACASATVATSLLFYRTTQRWYGPDTAAVGTVMAALYVNLHYYHVGANRPDTFYLPFELGVIYLYSRALEGGRRGVWRMLAAGACAVASVCFRQTAVAAPVAIVVHQVYLLATGRQRGLQATKLGVAFGAGAAGAVAGVVALLGWTSDLSAAWHAIVASNLGYITESKQSKPIPELYGWNEHAEVLGLPLILAAAAVVYALAGWRARPRPGRHAEPGLRFSGVLLLSSAWFLAATYLALIGPHRALHYYGLALPPLVLLATHGVWLLLRRDESARAPRFYVVLALLWFGYMALPALRHQYQATLRTHFQRFDSRASFRYAATVEAIERYTQPTDPILTWHYAPAVLWRTGRPVAHRYILETLIDQWRERAQPYVDELIRDVKASPPKALVVDPRDLRTLEAPPADHPVRYGDFAAWLREHYELPADAGTDDVWVRKD